MGIHSYGVAAAVILMNRWFAESVFAACDPEEDGD